MRLSVVKLVGVVTVSILALVLVVWLFENAGERVGCSLGRKTTYMILAGGTVLIVALNSGLLHDPWVVSALPGLNLAYFVAFLPFCYGMRGQVEA